MKRWTQKGRDENPDVRISKTLAYLLRHGAQNEGLKIDKAGYVRVDDILERIFFKSKRITANRIINIVETNERNRYELKRETDSTGKPVVYIRATEGHSLKLFEDDNILDKIEEASEVQLAVFGASLRAWGVIKTSGLKPMSKKYINFATSYPDESNGTIGMRVVYDVFIELDVEKALKNGMDLFLSKNNMILTQGFNGIISPEYFKKVLIREGGVLKDLDPKEYKDQPIQSTKGMSIEEFEEEKVSEQKLIEETKTLDINSNLMGQDFKYLAILDFEAQCSNTEKLTVQEIIEFPVVIVDVENRKIIEDKFHYYIKPVVYPKLLPFCIELTGIKQEQVDNGILLQDALENLDQFLKEKGILESSFCFVTCGNWDLNTCLKKEAKAKNIEVKDYLKRFINLKTNYPVPPLARVRNPDMVAMLKLSELELIGRHHSGIDDAVNIARVVVYLLEKDFKFKMSMTANAEY